VNRTITLQGLKRDIRVTGIVVGTAFAYLSVTSFLETWLKQGLPGFIGKLTEGYRRFVDVIRFIDPLPQHIVEWCNAHLRIDLAFSPAWKFLFVPASLYFLRAAVVSRSMGRRAFGNTQLVLGILVAFWLSVISSAAGENGLGPVVIAMSGFVCFDVGAAIARATFMPFPGETWWQTLRYHFIQRVGTDVVLCLLVAGAHIYAPLHIAGESAIYTLGYVVLAAVRDLATSLWVTLTHQMPDWPTSKKGPLMKSLTRWMQQGAFRHGLLVLAIILSAIGTIIQQSG
jgi:hypothetical protein